MRNALDRSYRDRLLIISWFVISLTLCVENSYSSRFKTLSLRTPLSIKISLNQVLIACGSKRSRSKVKDLLTKKKVKVADLLVVDHATSITNHCSKLCPMLGYFSETMLLKKGKKKKSKSFIHCYCSMLFSLSRVKHTL